MSEKKHETIDSESAWIRQLASLMHEQGLTEIELEKADVRLRVSRAAPAAGAHATTAPAVAPAPLPEAEPARPAKVSPASHPGAVTSPMVGTAYLSPSPNASPFVKAGDRVTQGQTILIVEAMKTMNPIAAPRDGVLKQILVSDAQPVEFGEPLAIIE